MAVMTVRQVLDKLKTELEAISPDIGVVQARLSFSPDQEAVISDWLFTDTTLGEVLKVFIITPEDGKEARATTGRLGYSHAAQNYKITGMVSPSTAGTGEPDLILEDAFEAIRTRLRALGRLDDGKDAFFTGDMDWTPIGMAKVANHNVLVKTMTLAIQDRKA